MSSKQGLTSAKDLTPIVHARKVVHRHCCDSIGPRIPEDWSYSTKQKGFMNYCIPPAKLMVFSIINIIANIFNNREIHDNNYVN